MKKGIIVCLIVLLLYLTASCAPRYEMIQTQSPAAADRLITPSASPKPSALPTTVPDTIPSASPAPNTTPAPIIEPMPSAVPKIDISELNPVVCDGLVLGGFDGKKWLTPRETIEPLREGETFKLYSLDGYLGDGMGNEIIYRQDYDYPTGIDVEMIGIESDTADEDFIAVGCDWDCMPRKHTVQPNDNRIYIDIVKDVLAENGLDNATVRIVQNYIIDLDGDGVNEVVLCAEFPPDKDMFNTREGTYSIVLLRKIIDGKVKNILLDSDIHETTTTFDDSDHKIRYIFSIRGFLDLNGDGKLEIITSSRYYEGEGYGVYEIINDAADRVIGNGWGA